MRSKAKPVPLKQKDYSKYPFMDLLLKDIEGEEWADIPQFDGYYSVSSYGRIWAMPRPVYSTKGQHYYTKERIRKQHVAHYYNSYTKDYNDQLTVHLRFGPESYTFQVCRLVYELFVGPINYKKAGLRVVHKDGDNCNNRYDNLVLMDGTQIYSRGLKLNRRPRSTSGIKKKKSLEWSETNFPRAVVKYTLDGKKLTEYESVAEAAKANHTLRGSVRNVATKKLKQLHGFVYRYKGDRYKGEHAEFSWVKPVIQYSAEGRKLATFQSVKEASVKTGIDANTISKCALRKFRFGSGYVWRYPGDSYKGEYTEIKKPKAIVKYSLDGKIIAHFSSANQASLKTGFNAATLLDCAHKRTKASHGFVWRFEGDLYKGEFKHYRLGKPVTQHTLEGKKIRTYPTIETAAKATGLTPDNIQKNVKGKNGTAGGFIWKYGTSKEIQKLPEFQGFKYESPAQGTKVIQYSLEGKKLAQYSSITEASKACKVSSSNISFVLDKPNRSAAGFVWRRSGNRYNGSLARNPAANKAKVVTQYDLQGMKIKVFKSTKEAEQKTGVPSTTISAVANGKLKTTGGYIWKYGDGPGKLDIVSSQRVTKPVIKYSLQGEFLAEYASIQDAAKAEGVSTARISYAANGRTKSAVGCLWKFL